MMAHPGMLDMKYAWSNTIAQDERAVLFLACPKKLFLPELLTPLRHWPAYQT
jgi:hypothetical protein